MAGIVSYATYVPRYRLDRADIATPLSIGASGASRGTRSVASFDEDTTTMGLEAARLALTDAGDSPGHLYFATSSPAYLEKSNSATIHAALGLPPSASALDLVGSPRTAGAALDLGLRCNGHSLIVLSDMRTSLPGGNDERDGADAAAAFVLSSDGGKLIAEHLGSATITDDLLDRWRVPTERCSRRWEEQFAQEAYAALGNQALAQALRTAGLDTSEVNHLAAASANGRAASLFARRSGVRKEALSDDLLRDPGNAGVTQPGLVLAGALDRAQPGDIVGLVVLADGAEAHLFRCTDAIAQQRTVQRSMPTLPVSYHAFLTWRGMLPVEPPRRPDPIEIAAPALRRATPWKLAYSGSKCTACGKLQFPPQRVCLNCKVVDQMEPVPMAQRTATIVTSLKDRISWSPSPPAAFAVANLDGGGRVECEVTEMDGIDLEPGLRVELVFRRLVTTRNGVHNYFWKLRPVTETEVN